MQTRILILYYSRGGSTRALARMCARGVEQSGALAVLRTVPNLDATAAQDAPLATSQDLRDCHGLLLGSPTRFGTLAAAMKAFIETLSSEWLSGTLIGKPAGVFCSTGSLHGGNEATLLSMIVPLLHHGMLIVGLPYSEPELMRPDAGGAPYGASHVAGAHDDPQLSESEKTLARALGMRVAQTAARLRGDDGTL